VSRPRQLLAAAFLSALLLTVAAGAAAAAPPAFDIRGTWQGAAVGSAYSGTTVWETEDCATGSISGRGSGGGSTWPASGTIDGTTVTLTFGPYDQDPSYTATGVGTLVAADRIAGTFHDTETYKEAAGDFQLARSSGPPQDGQGCGTTRHPTIVAVTCDYEVATSVDTCTATVGDIAGAPTSPTGTVTFAKTGGGFALGDTCTLASSPLAPATASCSVHYPAPIGATTFPAVSATYGGDAGHAEGSGTTEVLALGGPPQYDTPADDTVAVHTDVPADGTTVESCVTARAGATSAVAAAPSGEALAAAVRKAAAQLAQSSPAGSVAATNTLQRAVDNAAEGLSRLYEQIDTLARSSKPADQAQALKLKQSADDIEAAITKALQAQGDACKAAISNSTSRALVPLALTAATPTARLGYARVRSARKGPLTLRLKLSARALRRAAGSRRTVTAYLRVTIVQPSGRTRHGWPRSSVQRIALTRSGRLAR